MGLEVVCIVGHANAMSRPILRHILVRREAAGLEDGRAGMAQAFEVGLSCDISWFVEKRQDWKRVVLVRPWIFELVRLTSYPSP